MFVERIDIPNRYKENKVYLLYINNGLYRLYTENCCYLSVAHTDEENVYTMVDPEGCIYPITLGSTYECMPDYCVTKIFSDNVANCIFVEFDNKK